MKFIRQQSILKKLEKKWRKPRGLHSKLKDKKRGKGRRPRIGYGKAKQDKKFDYVTNLKEIDNKSQSIMISSTVGLKKKLELINKAKELNLQIVNIKNINDFLEKIKKRKQEKETKKEKKKQKESKKTEKKSKEDNNKTKEEKNIKIKEE